MSKTLRKGKRGFVNAANSGLIRVIIHYTLNGKPVTRHQWRKPEDAMAESNQVDWDFYGGGKNLPRANDPKRVHAHKGAERGHPVGNPHSDPLVQNSHKNELTAYSKLVEKVSQKDLEYDDPKRDHDHSGRMHLVGEKHLDPEEASEHRDELDLFDRTKHQEDKGHSWLDEYGVEVVQKKVTVKNKQYEATKYFRGNKPPFFILDMEGNTVVWNQEKGFTQHRSPAMALEYIRDNFSKMGLLAKMDCFLEKQFLLFKADNLVSSSKDTLFSVFNSGQHTASIDKDAKEFSVKIDGREELKTEDAKEALKKFYHLVAKIINAQTSKMDVALEMFGEHVMKLNKIIAPKMEELRMSLDDICFVKDFDYSTCEQYFVKSRIYLHPGEQPPKDVQVMQGKRGGRYYDSQGKNRFPDNDIALEPEAMIIDDIAWESDFDFDEIEDLAKIAIHQPNRKKAKEEMLDYLSEHDNYPENTVEKIFSALDRIRQKDSKYVESKKYRSTPPKPHMPIPNLIEFLSGSGEKGNVLLNMLAHLLRGESYTSGDSSVVYGYSGQGIDFSPTESRMDDTLFLLENYVEMATLGKQYSEDKLNQVMRKIASYGKKDNVVNGPAGVAPEYATKARNAYLKGSRLDKVLVFDALMSEQHQRGSVIPHIFNTLPRTRSGGYREEEDSVLAYFDLTVSGVLDLLAGNDVELDEFYPKEFTHLEDWKDLLHAKTNIVKQIDQLLKYEMPRNAQVTIPQQQDSDGDTSRPSSDELVAKIKTSMTQKPIKGEPSRYIAPVIAKAEACS